MPSSVIRTYSYDAKRGRLDIEFVSGESYSYFDVPEAVVSAFGRAFSKGRFFQTHIRDKFAYRRDRSGRRAVPTQM
jgi:lysyl-tRNA synthetase class 2